MAAMLLLLWLISGCAGAAGLLGSNRATLLGAERAETPLAAAEAYMRQYQPGELPRVFQTTRLYDRHGVLIGEMFGEGRRVWVALDQMAPALLDATVAVEDATFYSNTGVDARRIAGAAIQNLQEGEIVSGASTITMQLARNLFLGPDQRYDQSVDRKVLEAGIAQELTDLYSKEELLEMYLNLLNYGQLAYGPEAAAQVYFGKSAAELTMGEATLLAGIPQQPANLNPYENWEGARARQRVVLDLMVRHGYLTQSEADAVFEEPITLAGEPGLAPNLAPHFVQRVIEQLDAELGAGYTRRAGFQVMTTLDLELQRWAQQVVAQRVAEFQPVYDMSNAALVALQPNTGEVLVMVGSADFTNDAIAGQVNVALSHRQPGSAIKPVLVAAALGDDLVSPASVIWDIPVTYTIGLPASLGGAVTSREDLLYRPRNYDERFHGPVTLRSALANSYNIPMVKLLDRLSVPRMLEVARSLGISSLAQDDDWYGLSLTLGGGEVTLLDLTTAYHTLANGGIYRKPQVVRELRDSQGELIPDEALDEEQNVDTNVDTGATAGPTDGEAVIDPAAAFLVTDILADDIARQPAFGANSPLVLSRPAAAKTGTTSDYRDNWTVGYTRYLVTGVWAGNSDGRPMQSASGVTGAAPIWHDFMEGVLSQPELLARLEAPDDPAAWQFVPPSGVERLEICPPTLSCRSGGEYFRTTWLDAQGEAGPLGDSVAQMASAPVYVQQEDQARFAGFCGVSDGAARTMLLLPGMGSKPDVSLPTFFEVSEDKGVAAPAMTLEQQHVLAWAVRMGAPVYLGPCERLQEFLPLALALEPQETDRDLRVLVDLAAAGDPNAVTISADGGVPPEGIQRAVAVEGLAGGASAGLGAPIVHDGSCPGNYVMGVVVNRDGAPMADVRLAMTDGWGNQTIAVSKNGQSDYGMFDFPIYGDGPQNLQLVVVDENNNPRGAPVIVPHRIDAASDTPCHHVVIRGD
ncbi:MAG: transglycosylase domain-containing protein [Caldilineaceae bacterium]|nr:transglycosylase domain-containing protein [Caldilineaceae bacterium]